MYLSMFDLLASVRFYNMKVSVRGGIRKAPNAISWVYSISNCSTLGRANLDADQVIKAWILGQYFIIIAL